MPIELDYDLEACLEYNPQDEFDAHSIKAVLAVWEGQNEGDNWRWVLELTTGRFVFLVGWCDYTGWDCQSGANSYFADTPEQACEYEMEYQLYTTDEGVEEVRNDLLRQVKEGKKETWREQKDRELGVDSSNLLDGPPDGR